MIFNISKLLPYPGQRVYIPGIPNPVVFHGIQYRPGPLGWCRGLFAEEITKDHDFDKHHCSSRWSAAPIPSPTDGEKKVA